MNKFFVLIFIALSTTVNAQNQKIQEYIDAHKEIAMEEMIRTGVPAAIKLAQGIIETQAGQSDLVQRSNNHFGIKCKNNWTGAKTYHDDDARGECFRVYETAAESFRDHSEFLRTRAHYAFLFKLDPTDYEGWARGLKKAGYATNPKYPEMLIKTIVENNLQQYSLLAINRKNKVTEDGFVINADKKTGAEPELSLADEVVQVKTGGSANAATIVNSNNTLAVAEVEEPASKSAYPTGVFTINNVQVIYATAGSSLLALASKYNIAYTKLLEFNDMDEVEILEKDQLLFLQKKMKKGIKHFHVMAANETLHEVSQREGVRMENILLFNKLHKGDVPAAGEKIYLRSMAPAAPKLAASNATAASL